MPCAPYLGAWGHTRTASALPTIRLAKGTIMSTIQELAAEMAAAFETRTRDNGDTFDVLKDGSPEWMTDVCRDAHGDMLPDDWRYSMIRGAVEWIAETDDDIEGCYPFADGFVPVYNSERIAWLASHLNRSAYVDDAVSEYGVDPSHDGFSVTQTIGLGIYAEAAEVYSAVYNAMDALAD